MLKNNLFSIYFVFNIQNLSEETMEVNFRFSDDYVEFVEYKRARETHKRLRPASFNDEEVSKKRRVLEELEELVVIDGQEDVHAFLVTFLHTKLRDNNIETIMSRRLTESNLFQHNPAYHHVLFSIYISIIYSMNMLAQSNFKKLSVYLYKNDHQRMIRICIWKEYLVILDLNGEHQTPGHHGFQMKAEALSVIPNDLLVRILPLAIEIANNATQWSWGVSDNGPLWMNYSLEKWCINFANRFLFIKT